jgi:uncharacterized protein YjbI with pentapeptide repeats
MGVGAHVRFLKEGREAWNAWRAETPDLVPDLRSENLHDLDLSRFNFSGADLAQANLRRANLSYADLSAAKLESSWLEGANLGFAKLSKANLRLVRANGANFLEADLSRADLRSARLPSAILDYANLRRVKANGAEMDGCHFDSSVLAEADFTGCSLGGVQLSAADLTSANLRNCNLIYGTLVRTRVEGTVLTGSWVYGVSTWDLEGNPKDQTGLVISGTRNEALMQGPEQQGPSQAGARITVDNIEIAQFVNLLLGKPRIREAIDAITSRVVLVLGRFIPDRKDVLDALRAELRRQGLVALIFDFEAPTSRDLTETVTTLALLSRLVVADLTDPRSIPQELAQIVPNMPSVSIVPILQEGQEEYGMFEHFSRYPWVLPVRHYSDSSELISHIQDWIIAPAETARRSNRPHG